MVCDWTDETSVRRAALENASFDKILLDAPCTNTGVMRRRVDVRWRLQPDDFVPDAAAATGHSPRPVAPLLKPGGSLVYSTCSLEKEENEKVIEAFLAEKPRFLPNEIRKTPPFRDSIDGAFAARLERCKSSPGESAAPACYLRITTRYDYEHEHREAALGCIPSVAVE